MHAQAMPIWAKNLVGFKQSGNEETPGKGSGSPCRFGQQECHVAQAVLMRCGRLREVIHRWERAHREVVCRVSILPSNAQDAPESMFCSAFHQSLILGSSPINQLGWGRKRTETTQHLACADGHSCPELRPWTNAQFAQMSPSDHSPTFQLLDKTLG